MESKILLSDEKKNQEIYKVDTDIIKKHIFDCASVYTNDLELCNNKNVSKKK
jgi:hypothetical protein